MAGGPATSKSDSSIVACTIVTKSFLAHARVLGESLRAHHPGAKLYVLLADRVENRFEPSREPFTLIQMEELGASDVIRRMCFYYTPFELCCALRGVLHEYMAERLGLEKWLFIDGDVLICGSLERVWSDLDHQSLLLSIHCRSSAPRESVAVERAMMAFGGLPHRVEALREQTPQVAEEGDRRPSAAVLPLDKSLKSAAMCAANRVPSIWKHCLERDSSWRYSATPMHPGYSGSQT
jgi:hypothetical protein